MQQGVIIAAQKYGLGLDEKLLAQYLNELNFSSHIVGKVSDSTSVVTASRARLLSTSKLYIKGGYKISLNGDILHLLISLERFCFFVIQFVNNY